MDKLTDRPNMTIAVYRGVRLLERGKGSSPSHPLYSPGLSPCDFFLFPFLKKTFLVVVMNSKLVVQLSSGST